MTVITTDIENFRETQNGLAPCDWGYDALSQKLAKYVLEVFLKRESNSQTDEVNGSCIELCSKGWPKIEISFDQEGNRIEDWTGNFYCYQYLLPQNAFNKVLGLADSLFAKFVLDYQQTKSVHQFVEIVYRVKYSKNHIRIKGMNIWHVNFVNRFFREVLLIPRITALGFALGTLLSLVVRVHVRGVYALLGTKFSYFKEEANALGKRVALDVVSLRYLVKAVAFPSFVLKKEAEKILNQKKSLFFRRENDLRIDTGFLYLTGQL